MKIAKKFDHQFLEVINMIHEARFNAIKSVNSELIKLYWNIGQYISKKLEDTLNGVTQWLMFWPNIFKQTIQNLKGLPVGDFFG